MKKVISAILFSLTHSVCFANLGAGTALDSFYVHHHPDPVNVRTGNFYLPSPDYLQSCFGFNLELHRSYNSFSAKKGSFGKGWTHNYELSILFDPGSGLSVLEADGFLHEYEPIESKDKGLLSKNKTSPSGKYYSSKRGYSEISTNPSGYERTFETGQKEIYDLKGRVLKFVDRNANQLSFRYDAKGQLMSIEDTCRQSLQITYNKKDLIEVVTDAAQRKMVYAYDDKDRLQFATTLDEKTTEYVYNLSGQMIGIKFTPTSIVTMQYDPKSSRVVSQVGPGKKTTTYDYTKSGGSVTTLVKDNEGENSKYEFVDAENKMSVTDSKGKKTTTEFLSCCGKVLSIKDEKGVGETFSYDSTGRLEEIKNALGQTSSFKYDPRSLKDFTFRLPTEIKDFDGSIKTYNYDSKGNLTFAKSTSKENVQVKYEEHGKIKSIVNQDDIGIHFLYDDKGRPQHIEKRKKDASKVETVVGAMTISYNALGDVSEVAYKPRLEKTVDDIKSTLLNLFRILKPVGIDFEL